MQRLRFAPRLLRRSLALLPVQSEAGESWRWALKSDLVFIRQCETQMLELCSEGRVLRGAPGKSFQWCGGRRFQTSKNAHMKCYYQEVPLEVEQQLELANILHDCGARFRSPRAPLKSRGCFCPRQTVVKLEMSAETNVSAFGIERGPVVAGRGKWEPCDETDVQLADGRDARERRAAEKAGRHPGHGRQ